MSVTTVNRDLVLLHAAFREKVEGVLARLEALQLPFRVFEAYRTPARQAHLYAQGRTRPGAIITNARPWQSYHQYGLAVDLVLFENGRWSWDDSGFRAQWWRDMNQVGRDFGLEPLSWEKPHLQLAGYTWRRLHGGDYPSFGGEEWATHMREVIFAWSGTPAAPPMPLVSVPVPDPPPLIARPEPITPRPPSLFEGLLERLQNLFSRVKDV